MAALIRFMADTWRDAVLRPLAMAAPDGWVYVEVLAPDIRFALAMLMVLVLLIMRLKKGKYQKGGQTPVFLLFAISFASFIPWMATSGNGRYFMPYIIAVGPLVVALIYLLPATRWMRFSLVILTLIVQGFALFQNSPWTPFGSWEFVAWKKPPYFSLEIPPGAIKGDETFITVANMSYSAVAPLFPDSVRWINLSIFNGGDVESDFHTYQPVREMLKDAKQLMLFQKAQPHAMREGTFQPNQRAIEALNAYLTPHRLGLRQPVNCRLLKSGSASESTSIPSDVGTEERSRLLESSGFWLCPLHYPVTTPGVAKQTFEELQAKQAINKMEQVCPRFFPPGQALVLQHGAGFARNYAQSDSSLIVTRDGNLYVKNARALNPELIGKVAEILKPGFAFDCTRFRGRSGLPWEREI